MLCQSMGRWPQRHNAGGNGFASWSATLLGRLLQYITIIQYQVPAVPSLGPGEISLWESFPSTSESRFQANSIKEALTTATSQPSDEPHILSTRSGSQAWMGLFLGCSFLALGVVAAPYFYTLESSLYLLANPVIVSNFLHTLNSPCSNDCVLSFLVGLDWYNPENQKDYTHITRGMKDKQLDNKRN